ncbi:uncharacterized protein LOC120076013 isoform X1 [Benincasa hispida]|uniref:uncharacterized protein LOC120076013 isoform X1 n=1 Tax=Benincasa hispida TaxID=102211 RepID=UPI00190291C1|nr:uncharacterized protein LOC120076013 isoform X1 [Benincasa hispida]
MEGKKGNKGYAWAIAAGLNAAFSAIAAKLFSYTLIRYGLVVAFNLAMWGCYVNSLKTLSSLQATGTNFSANFLCSGLAGFFLFEEMLSFQFRRSVQVSQPLISLFLESFRILLVCRRLIDCNRRPDFE